MTITCVTRDDLPELLPLLADYQRFYGVADIDSARNHEFFAQFAVPNARGVLHVLRVDGVALGFSTIYFSFSSALAKPVAVLNDLFVAPEARGRGFGRALIEQAAVYARDAGYVRLQWLTRQDNAAAQGLYDAFGAKKSAWYFYALNV